jgi:hypothetical protein
MTDHTDDTATERDWLAQLRDPGPRGAAPDAHHAAIWGAILDLRGCRDTIENTLERMTEKLDQLADETTLTHAIAAGWPPDNPDPGETAPGDDDGAPIADDDPAPGRVAGVHADRVRDKCLRDRIERIGGGLCTMQTLIHSRRDQCGGLDQDAVISLEFCLESLQEALEKTEELLETVEVHCKPEAAPAASREAGATPTG